MKTHEFPFAFHDEANHTHFFLVSPLRHTQKKQYQALQRILTKKPTIQVSSCLSTPQKKTRSDNILNRRNLRSCTIDDDSFLSALPFFPGNRVSPCFVSPNQKLIKEKKAVPIRRWCPNQPPQHYTGGATRLLLAFFFSFKKLN